MRNVWPRTFLKNGEKISVSNQSRYMLKGQGYSLGVGLPFLLNRVVLSSLAISCYFKKARKILKNYRGPRPRATFLH